MNPDIEPLLAMGVDYHLHLEAGLCKQLLDFARRAVTEYGRNHEFLVHFEEVLLELVQ